MERRTVFVVGLLCLTNLLSYLDRTALSILLPPIRSEFALSDTQLGVLTGIAFAAFYAVAGIPIAYLADRWSRTSIVSISVTAWSIATMLTGAATSFFTLFLARMGTAVGEAGALPPSHSLFSDLFPPEKRAGVLAIHSAFGPIGTFLGLAAGGWLAVEVGWRWTFIVFGLPGIMVALLVYVFVKEPIRGASDHDQTADSPVKFLTVLKILSGKLSYVYVMFALAIGTFVVTGLVQWLPSYFVRSFALTTIEVGRYYGLAFGGGSFLGMVMGAGLANILTKRDLRWTMWIPCISYLLVFPLYLGVLLSDSFLLAIWLVAIAATIAGLGYGPVWAAIQNVVPSSMRATATAIALFGANLIGGGLGPLMVGILSDVSQYGSDTERLRFGLMVATSLTPIPIVFFWLSAKHFHRDLVG